MEFVQIAVIATVALGIIVGGRVIQHWVGLHYRSVKPSAGSEPLEVLEDRIAALEAVAERVGDLEERVEFAERLLARQREQERLPHGS